MSIAAVVTGHTRGLGAAIAESLLEREATVFGLARGNNATLADRFGDKLRQTRLDLSDTEGLARWLKGDHLARYFEGATMALLVNNAGLLEPVGPLQEQDVASVAAAVAVNVSAALMLSAAFVQATSQISDRRILHIASGAATRAYAGWSVYGATKAALDHHARGVALDQTPHLRIASIAPGVIDTDMQTHIRSVDERSFPMRQRFVKLKREHQLLDPREAGRDVVEFLFARDFGNEPVVDLRARLGRG